MKKSVADGTGNTYEGEEWYLFSEEYSMKVSSWKTYVNFR